MNPINLVNQPNEPNPLDPVGPVNPLNIGLNNHENGPLNAILDIFDQLVQLNDQLNGGHQAGFFAQGNQANQELEEKQEERIMPG